MISIIIPTLNEAQNLARCIAAVRRNKSAHEMIVVDGGSEDGTNTTARRAEVELIHSQVRQRAAQMNVGARSAHGQILLFLHADTILTPTSLKNIERALMNQTVGGGAFARRFDSDSKFLQITCLLAEFRNRTIGWHLGDQAHFVRRELFERLGGFRPMDRFEDLDFSRRLRKISRLVTLRPPVLSSARRFVQDGPFKRTFKDLLLTLSFLSDNLPFGRSARLQSHSDRVNA